MKFTLGGHRHVVLLSGHIADYFFAQVHLLSQVVEPDAVLQERPEDGHRLPHHHPDRLCTVLIGLEKVAERD